METSSDPLLRSPVSTGRGLNHKWIRRAFKVAEKSTHPKHRMAAVVVKGGRIVGQSPNLPRDEGYPYLKRGRHAEIRAIAKTPDPANAVLYIVRSNGLISKPCPSCMAMIKASGIDKIIYMDAGGTICQEKV